MNKINYTIGKIQNRLPVGAYLMKFKKFEIVGKNYTKIEIKDTLKELLSQLNELDTQIN